jgi:hypothetical protein
MGGKGREGIYTPQKKNSMMDLVGNEEIAYPVPDPPKTMTNVSDEPSDAEKISFKEEIPETKKNFCTTKEWSLNSRDHQQN